MRISNGILATDEVIWQNARRGRFTSSELHRLMTGKSDLEMLKGHKTYIKEVLAELLTSATYSWGGNGVTEHGHEFEEQAIERFSLLHGKEIECYGTEQRFFPKGDFFGGTPDGLVMEDDAVAEIKCPFNPQYHIDRLLNVSTGADLLKHDSSYYWQCMGNCYATGASRAYFISYHPDFPDNLKLKVVELEFTEEARFKIEARLNSAVAYLKKLQEKLVPVHG